MIVEEKIKTTSGSSQLMSPLIDHKIETYAFLANTLEEKIKIEVYEAGIVRVRVTKNDSFDSFDYPLEEGLNPIYVDYIETETSYLITTDLLDVVIEKEPFRIIFKNKKGQVINEDDPSFGTHWIGEQVTTYKRLQEDEKFLGLGEKTGPLNKRGRGYENWNTDHFGYGVEDDPLYCSIPFYLGVHHELAYGIFLNNSHKSHFNFGASNNRFSSFSADAGDMDYFFFYQPTVKEIIAAYSRITGKMSLPPKWSLGYQQCRYSYYPDSEVLNTARTFRDKDIPADVMVLDIHYMDAFKIFTWDRTRFPKPIEMINQLKDLGFKVVVMCDPGIKVEPGYHAYDDGLENDVFVKYPDGENYEGEVWPGWCHFPDFTNPKARDWWEEKLKCYADLGIEGFWNDMNEIATWGQQLPELLQFDFDGESTTSRKARNIYGLLMAKSTMQGAKSALKGKRPFNLTRSGFAGIQKYAAVWTGDNVASDEHMLLGIRMLNGMGLSGVPFAGFDTGGFVGNASEQLFARWISLAAFTPFFRGHSNVNTKSSEPWAFGESTEEISRNYIKLRYRLMPYVYSTFYEASETGTPINRSLAIDYTYDPKIYEQAYENEFLFGQALLITPVVSTKEVEKIYLPEGRWYDLLTDQVYNGSAEQLIECPVEKVPAFVKSSAIIPMQSQTSNTQQKVDETMEVHLYNGPTDNHFIYYEDDGESYDYQDNDFHKRIISFHSEERKLVFGMAVGTYPSQFKSVRIYFHGFENTDLSKLAIEHEDYRFIQPLSNFDPLSDGNHADYCINNLPYITTNIDNQELEIQW